MKKAVWFAAALLAMICLFLSGCADPAPSGIDSKSDSEEISLSQAQKEEPPVVSSAPEEEPIRELRLSDYGITQDREAYFSQERYIDWDFTTGGLRGDRARIDWESMSGYNNQFYLETDEFQLISGKISYQKVPILAVREKMDHVFWESRYLLYYSTGGALYRAFIPDYPNIEPEKVGEFGEEFQLFLPVTNFVTVICFPSEEWKAYLEKGDASIDFTGIQYDYAFFDARDRSLTPFRLSDLGLDDRQFIVTIPQEDLYKIP